MRPVWQRQLAIRGNKPVQEVSVPELQKILKSQGGVFEYVRYPQQGAMGIVQRMLQPKGPARSNWEY